MNPELGQPALQVEYRGTKRLLGFITKDWHGFAIATSWAQGGPFMVQEEMFPSRYYGAAEHKGKVYQCQWDNWRQIGSTPLVAVARCYLASKRGDSVDITSELM
jgi:hypothetical protein